MRSRLIIAIAVVFVACTRSSSDVSPAATTKVGNFVGTVIYPAAIGGTVDDWAPTGLSNATTIVASLSSATTLTSLTGGAAGRRIDICNSTAFVLSIPHDTGGTAADRFLLPNGSTWVLGTTSFSMGLSCASFVYDSTATRWRMDARSDTTFPSLSVTAGMTFGDIGAGILLNLQELDIYGGAGALQSFRAGAQDEMVGASAEGALNAPTATINGRQLGAWEHAGFDSGAYVNGGQISASTNEAFTNIANGSHIEIRSSNIGSTVASTPVLIGPGNRAAFSGGVIAGAVNQLQFSAVAGTQHTYLGGHLITNGNNLSFSAGAGCGSGPAPACNSTTCNDTAGTFTTGGGITACTLTFLNTYTGADDAGCTIQPLGVATVPTFTTSATALVASVILPTQKYSYICFGHL